MEITMRNAIATPVLTALTADTETAIEWPESDEKMTLVISASASTDLTVLAGNSIQGVADLSVSIPVGVSLLKLESGRFKNVTGTNKGKIVVKSSGTPKIGAAALI